VICPADARPPPILATNYDQTCTADSDCIAEGFGDPCECLSCVNAAINQKSEPQYRADRARTPNVICFCAFGPAAACCVHGMCQLAYQCSNPIQPTDAGAETAGGSDASDADADVAADVATDAGRDAADASAE
jgi:hypothetical protein